MDKIIIESSKAMQAVLAPVFLISAVGVLVATMTTRYGRVIDRVRVLLKEAGAAYAHSALPLQLADEINRLYKRARLIRTTIILSCISIFLVVLAIFFMFADYMVGFPQAKIPEILFLLALACLIAALGLFIEDFAISLNILKEEINFRLNRQFLDESGERTKGS